MAGPEDPPGRLARCRAWFHGTSGSGGRFEGAPLIGVTTSEIRKAERVDPTPEERSAAGRDGARPHLPARDRSRRRASGGAPAAPDRGDRAAARPPRRDLPLRRARPRPGRVRAGPPRRARPHLARPRHRRARGGPRGRLPRAADPGDLPWRAGAQRRSARDSLPASRPTASAQRSSTARRAIGTEAGPPGRDRARQQARQGARARPASRSTPSTTSRPTSSGRGLRAVGFSPDGVIEAIEAPRLALRRRRPVARRVAHRAPRAGRASSAPSSTPPAGRRRAQQPQAA